MTNGYRPLCSETPQTHLSWGRGRGPCVPIPESLSSVSPERVLELPTKSPSPLPRPVGHLQGLVIGVTSVLVGVLLLLLLTWVLATRGNAPASPHCCPSQAEPEALPEASPGKPGPCSQEGLR